MQSRLQPATYALFAVVLAGFVSAQSPPAQAPAARSAKGIPPRANAGEYLAHAQVGAVTMGAEFDEHSVPTPEAILSTEEYVAVEVGLFGAPGAHVTVSS